MEPTTSRNGKIDLTRFWGYLFNYYCDLSRDRCYYADLIQRQIEDHDLNVEIDRIMNQEWTILHRRDRNLKNQAPALTASTDHKKSWLFQTKCAFEFAELSVDSSQKNLFDFGFAVFDPV